MLRMFIRGEGDMLNKIIGRYEEEGFGPGSRVILSIGVALGIILGTAAGAQLDLVGEGIAIGIVVGAIIGTVIGKKYDSQRT